MRSMTVESQPCRVLDSTNLYLAYMCLFRIDLVHLHVLHYGFSLYLSLERQVMKGYRF